MDVLSFWGMDSGWYGLTNRRMGVGFGMTWDAALFKSLWMWQSYGGHDDYPWYGHFSTAPSSRSRAGRPPASPAPSTTARPCGWHPVR